MDLNVTGNIFPDVNWSTVWQSMPSSMSGGISAIITTSKILLIIFIIYFIVLIISKLISIRNSFSLKRIADNVSEINTKVSLLVSQKAKSNKKK